MTLVFISGADIQLPWNYGDLELKKVKLNEPLLHLPITTITTDIHSTHKDQITSAIIAIQKGEQWSTQI